MSSQVAIFTPPFGREMYQKAQEFLKKGKLVVMPTETVYGIAGHVAFDDSIQSIYQVKGRPSHNPLIVHVSSLEVAEKYALFSRDAYRLAETFWPGPLTLILPLKNGAPVSPYVTAGLSTIALRIPRFVCYDVLKGLDFGLAIPSANLSTKLSPSRFSHLHPDIINGVSAVFDGGECPIGLESTVLDLSVSEPTVLRYGYVLPEDISAILQKKVKVKDQEDDGLLKAPGMMLKHYSPQKPVRINAYEVRDDEYLLGFGDVKNATLNLSKRGDYLEASYHLYDMLYKLDCMQEKACIAVSPIPAEGLGLAINDRLQRASHKGD